MSNKLITSAMLEDIRLQHHGVLGQKWGVRRTPEQLGHKQRSSKDIVTDSNKKYGIEELLISLGAAVVIAGSAAISSKFSDKKATKLETNSDLKISKLSEANTIKPPESYLKSVKSTNTKGLSSKFNYNCSNTAIAYDLRRRGYDIQAKPSTNGLTIREIQDLFKVRELDVNITDMNKPHANKKNIEKLNSYFDSMPNGYRGVICVTWKGGMSGHAFNVEKVNGQPIFIDSQKGTHGAFKGNNVLGQVLNSVKKATVGGSGMNPSLYLTKAEGVEIFRTDNAGAINESNLGERILKR